MITKREFCDLLGLSLSDFSRYEFKGLPVQRVNGKVMLELDEAKEWITEFEARLQEDEEEVDINDPLLKAKLRRLEVEIERLQLKLAVEREQYVAVDQIQTFLEKTFSKMRNSLISIPGNIAPDLVGLTNVAEIQIHLTKEISKALQHLQTGDYIDEDDDTE